MQTDVRPAMLRMVRVAVPLVRPHRSAAQVERVRDVVLVEWTRHDGFSGWGECPTLSDPGYVTSSTGEAWHELTRRLGPDLFATGSSDSLHGPGSSDRRGPGGPGGSAMGGLSAERAVLHDACLDARLRSEHRSLASYLGVARSTVPRSKVLADVGIGHSELMEQAIDAVLSGATMIKVKVAPGDDVERVRAVLESIDGPAVRGSAAGVVAVAADANGSYESPSQLRELDQLGLAYVEQPFAPDLSWHDHARLRRELRTPVAMDESLGSLSALRSALHAGALDVVSLKAARLGGTEAALQAGRLAASAGVDVFVGGMLELGVGRAAAAALAAMDFCTLPTDLGPSAAYVERDVCEPIVIDAVGDLVVPEGAGIGRQPDPGRLAEVTVDEWSMGQWPAGG